MPKKLRLGSLGWTCEFVCIHFSQLTTCKYHFLFHIQLVTSFILIGFLLQEKEVVKMATELLKCEASQMLMMRKEEARRFLLDPKVGF